MNTKMVSHGHHGVSVRW